MATRRSYRFSPYRPPAPPAGSYDPGLDAQRAAGSRGLFDLRQDVETAGGRAASDYGISRDELQRQAGLAHTQLRTGYDANVGDLETNRTRTLADLNLAASRGEEDWQRNIAMLTRNYKQLRDRQQEGRNVAGVIRGGAALQAAAKRSENMRIERQPLDVAHRRQAYDLDVAGQRAKEDYTRSIGRLDTDYTAQNNDIDAGREFQMGQLGLGFQRGEQDRTTQLTRAERENQAFGLDIGAQQAYQAAGAGWSPPGRGQPGGMPSNEFVNPATGAHHRVINGIRYDQFGRPLGRATGRF